MSLPASGSPECSIIEHFGPLLQLPDQLSRVQRSIDELKDLMQTLSTNGEFVPLRRHPHPPPLDPHALGAARVHHDDSGRQKRLMKIALSQCAIADSRHDVSDDEVEAKPLTAREALRQSLMGDRVSVVRPSTRGPPKNRRGSIRSQNVLGHSSEEIGASVAHALRSAPLIKGGEVTLDVRASSEPSSPSYIPKKLVDRQALYAAAHEEAPRAKRAPKFASVLPDVIEADAEERNDSEITKPSLSQTSVNVVRLEDKPDEKECPISFGLCGLPNAVKNSDAENGSEKEAPGQPCVVEDHGTQQGGDATKEHEDATDHQRAGFSFKASDESTAGDSGDNDSAAGSQLSNNNLQKWSLGGYGMENGQNRRVSLSSISALRRKSADDLSCEDSNAGWLDRSVYMIAPDAPIRAAFDVVLLMSIAFFAFWAPVQLAYERQRIMHATLHAGFYIADAVMILDVLLGFFTGRETEDGRLEMDPDIITSRYLRSWFFVDLLAACPISVVQDPAADTYMAFRCFKIAKYIKFPHVLSNLQMLANSSAVSYLKMFMPLLITAHVLACCWQLIRQKDNLDNAQPLLVEDYGFEFYLQDIYWVVMTMTSVGYGDIVPTGAAGRIFATAVMLVSSAYCGFVVSTTQQVIKVLYDDELEKQVRDAGSFMHRRHVTTELQKRVEHCVRQQVRREQSLAFAPRLLEKLSPPMQRELSLQLLKKVIVQFPLFQGTQSSYVAQLAHAHTWLLALGGDLVVEEGQVVQEMVFVVQGKLLCLMSATRASVVLAYEDDVEEEEEGGAEVAECVKDTWYETGAWFGERCLFVPGEARQYTMIADTDAELAVLTGSEYRRVTELYPKLWLRHRALVKQTQLGKMNLDNLAYVHTEKKEEGMRHFFSCCFKG